MRKEENLWTPRSIRTRSGIYVNVFEPKPEMFCIEDIAHALSMAPRFGGHLPFHYSVAQHSINVARSVRDEFKLQALMHDASEAYLMDLPSPIKADMPYYKYVEYRLMTCIASAMRFPWPMTDTVKAADRMLLELEWKVLMLEERMSDREAELDLSFGRKSHEMAAAEFLHYFRKFAGQEVPMAPLPIKRTTEA